jgi:Cu/Ag efflux protein CusF
MTHRGSALPIAACIAPIALQPPSPVHAGAEPGAATPAAGAMAEGEVCRIDKAAARVTLRHGEVRILDMPPMTMVFGVRDETLLDRLQVGDEVRAVAVAVDDRGQYAVTAIEKLN